MSVDVWRKSKQVSPITDYHLVLHLDEPICVLGTNVSLDGGKGRKRDYVATRQSKVGQFHQMLRVGL
jgi:hypothetical protein